MKNFFLVSAVFLFSIHAMEKPPKPKTFLRRITNRAINWLTPRIPLPQSSHAHDTAKENNIQEPFAPLDNSNRELSVKEKESIKSRELAVMAQELIAAHRNLNSVYPPYHFPLLFETVTHDSRLETTKKLLDHGAYPNISIKIFRITSPLITPIYKALTYQAFKTATELIERGANIKGQLLMHEIMRQHKTFDTNWSDQIRASVQLLLDAGLDLNEKDGENNTCIYQLLCDHHQRMLPKQELICLDHRKSMLKILLDNGLNAQSKNIHDRTALQHAQLYSSDFISNELAEFLRQQISKQKIS